MKITIKYSTEQSLGDYKNRISQNEQFWMIDVAKEMNIDRNQIRLIRLNSAYEIGFTSVDGKVEEVKQERTFGFFQTSIPAVVAVFPSWKHGVSSIKESEQLVEKFWISQSNNGYRQNAQLFVDFDVYMLGELTEEEELQQRVDENEEKAKENMDVLVKSIT